MRKRKISCGAHFPVILTMMTVFEFCCGWIIRFIAFFMLIQCDLSFNFHSIPFQFLLLTVCRTFTQINESDRIMVTFTFNRARIYCRFKRTEFRHIQPENMVHPLNFHLSPSSNIHTHQTHQVFRWWFWWYVSERMFSNFSNSLNLDHFVSIFFPAYSFSFHFFSFQCCYCYVHTINCVFISFFFL